MWPHCGTVAKKCINVYNDNRDNKDIQKYKTTGMEDKRVVEKKKPMNHTNNFYHANYQQEEQHQ